MFSTFGGLLGAIEANNAKRFRGDAAISQNFYGRFGCVVIGERGDDRDAVHDFGHGRRRFENSGYRYASSGVSRFRP